MDARHPIHVTYHNDRRGKHSKMLNMVSINTDTYSNPFCRKMAEIPGSVCERCYAMRLSKFYGPKSCAPFVRNMGLLNNELQDWQIPRLNVAYCRFHSFGELGSELHFQNFCRIAEANPDTHFALWTKRPALVDVAQTPPNLMLIHSTLMVDGRPSIPEGFHKAFTVYTLESNVAINCRGQCIRCLNCYKKDSGVSFIKEVLR